MKSSGVSICLVAQLALLVILICNQPAAASEGHIIVVDLSDTLEYDTVKADQVSEYPNRRRAICDSGLGYDYYADLGIEPNEQDHLTICSGPFLQWYDTPGFDKWWSEANSATHGEDSEGPDSTSTPPQLELQLKVWDLEDTDHVRPIPKPPCRLGSAPDTCDSNVLYIALLKEPQELAVGEIGEVIVQIFRSDVSEQLGCHDGYTILTLPFDPTGRFLAFDATLKDYEGGQYVDITKQAQDPQLLLCGDTIEIRFHVRAKVPIVNGFAIRISVAMPDMDHMMVELAELHGQLTSLSSFDGIFVALMREHWSWVLGVLGLLATVWGALVQMGFSVVKRDTSYRRTLPRRKKWW